MNQIIPQDTIDYLKSTQVTSEDARRVLRKLIRKESASEVLEAEISIVFQVLLASNYSNSKISETLASLRFPEDFISDFVGAFASLPKIRAGVTLPMLVDVNWKSIHEISTSNIRKIHAPAVSVEAVIQECEGEITTLPFTCTKPQLAELVYKLKAALEQIDKTYKN